MKKALFISFVVFTLRLCVAQNFTRITPNVSENSANLLNPFAGGLNQPQFSIGDIDQDGQVDLYAFDRSSAKSLFFKGLGYDHFSENWQHLPSAEAAFGNLNDWVLLRDFNCDGKLDIFAASDVYDGIQVRKNTSTSAGVSNLVFSPFKTVLTFDTTKIFVSKADIPAIRDVDGDGDLDILTYNSQGQLMLWFRNLSLENYGTCDSLVFERADQCWGKYQEDGLSNAVTLNQICGSTPDIIQQNGVYTNQRIAGHAGSTIEAFDQDNDGALELVLGDLSASNIVYLHNGGTNVAAFMDAYDDLFPANDVTVNNYLFPAGFAFDADQDGLQDLVFAPNTSTITGNFNNVDFYKNVGTVNNATFELTETAFLQNTMIDCGSSAHPTFVDINSDGLLDLVIGNEKYQSNPSDANSDLTVYLNTGTASNPAFSLQTRTWLGLANLFANPKLLGAHPTFGDLDADGDQDLILGDSEGKIHYFRNQAAANQPMQLVLLQSNFAGIDVGAAASPQLIDLNRDGTLDLVIGRQEGKIIYHQNTGTPSNPVFSAVASNNNLGGIDVNPVCCTGFSVPFVFQEAGEYKLLVSGEEGGIWLYDQINNNLNGNFNLVSNSFPELDPGRRFSLSLADLNGDHTLELAIGNLRGGISLWSSDLSTDLQTNYPNSSQYMQLHPNPAQNQLHIDISQFTTPVRYQIYNQLGENLQSGNISQASSTLSIQNLATGTYILRLIADNNATQMQQVFVKQ